MDKYNYGNHHGRETENQSFSSTLLDAIYRSIDEPAERNFTADNPGKNEASLRWMETKTIPVRRRSAADFQRKPAANYDSSSSSSDSSSGGGIFSSSELESVYGSASYRPKSIRTSLPSSQNSDKQFKVFDNYYPNQDKNIRVSQQKLKQEGGFVKTKSRALKIYGDLKKVKQPISPGGRLATFLNSLFTPGNTKKTKNSSTSTRSYDDVNLEMKSKSAQTSTCSSASSFSRSCLSKNPSTRVKSSNAPKRTVHFYPASVDEDLKTYGHKSLQPNSRDVRSFEEKYRQLEKNYQKMSIQKDFVMRNTHTKNDELEDEDDDCASCASSDLFELDSLRYREELPVYETTHFDTNRKIASGMIM